MAVLYADSHITIASSLPEPIGYREANEWIESFVFIISGMNLSKLSSLHCTGHYRRWLVTTKVSMTNSLLLAIHHAQHLIASIYRWIHSEGLLEACITCSSGQGRCFVSPPMQDVYWPCYQEQSWSQHTVGLVVLIAWQVYECNTVLCLYRNITYAWSYHSTTQSVSPTVSKPAERSHKPEWQHPLVQTSLQWATAPESPQPSSHPLHPSLCPHSEQPPSSPLSACLCQKNGCIISFHLWQYLRSFGNENNFDHSRYMFHQHTNYVDPLHIEMTDPILRISLVVLIKLCAIV